MNKEISYENLHKKKVSYKEFNMFVGYMASVWYVLALKENYLPQLSTSVMISEYWFEDFRGTVIIINLITWFCKNHLS